MTDRMVDVGGYRLSTRITGTGAPPVVCLAALGLGHDDWTQVAAALAETAQIITYGRAGVAGSDPLPAAEAEQLRSAAWFASQLRTLLRHLGITPPYVFATGSIGAFIADRYAETWPEEVSGMVLVDPTNPSPFPAAAWEGETLEDGDGGARFQLADWHAELNQVRNGHPIPTVVLSSAVGRWLRGESKEWSPLTLAEVDAQWQGHQREWVRRWSARQVVADTAGHHVYREEPRLVASVVEAMIVAARVGGSVCLDPATIAQAGGQIRS